MQLLVLLASLILQDATSQRIPEPEAEAQKQALKSVRDLFKDEYAKKTPSDQLDLARKLIAASADASIDMPTKYVLLAEARDLAVLASDPGLALEAVTGLGKAYMIAVPAAKLSILNKMSMGAKDPEKIRAIGKAYFDLARESVSLEDYETASTAAGKSEALSRAVKDISISERVIELKKELAGLKSEFQKVKSYIDHPANGDPDTVGRYLCFVRNDWASGLKILSENGKSPLKELAAKDLSNPESTEGQVEVGDGWWQLSQAEKTSWKKLNLLGRARRWYEMAQSSASGLVKVRVDKRLAEVESAVPGGGVNLLQMVDPKRDAVHGNWSLDDGVLVDRGEQTLTLQIPYQPPEEYDLYVAVKRVGGTDSASVGVVVAGTQAVVCIDGYPTNGMWLSGFEVLEGKILRDQASPYKGKQLIEGEKPTPIVIQVRKTSLTLLVNGKRIASLEGVAGKLANRPDSGTPDPKALFVGGWNGKMGFTEIRITPLSGPGKKTR